jgi:hypothetical protein
VNAFSRRYVKEVAKCDALERKLNELEAKIKAEGVKIPKSENIGKATASPTPQELDSMVVSLNSLSLYF